MGHKKAHSQPFDYFTPFLSGTLDTDFWINLILTLIIFLVRVSVFVEVSCSECLIFPICTVQGLFAQMYEKVNIRNKEVLTS